MVLEMRWHTCPDPSSITEAEIETEIGHGLGDWGGKLNCLRAALAERDSAMGRVPKQHIASQSLSIQSHYAVSVLTVQSPRPTTPVPCGM